MHKFPILFFQSVLPVTKNLLEKESYPTDIRDVRKVLSIDELMDELRKFDDEKLYPYVVGLIEKLKIAVSPSPMII